MKTIRELLSEMRSLGVQLWNEEDRLRYTAPKGVITPSLRQELKERKAEILKFLQQTDSGSALTIEPISRDSQLPLSFAQERLWFLDRLESNSSLYYLARAVRLNGNLNIRVLQQSLDAIVVHHEILRTNYIAENGNPIQVIGAPQSVELQIIDLQQYNIAQQETQLQKLLQQESQRRFDLLSDIMLRGCLLQLAPEEYVLLLVMHHIASDGWSMGILWKQLTQVYQAFLNGQPNPLPKLPIQYADYAVWQRDWLSGEVLDKQLNYWQQQLAGANSLLELPTDFPRPAVQTYRGNRQSLTLSKNLSESLRQFCRQEGVTLYMILLAAFQTLLFRYSKQEDIIVGSPIAGRNRAEIEGIIGLFVNTLVLRTDLSGNPSFRELLTRVRSVTLDAYSHQDLPFEKLVEILNPERSLSYNPIFQVLFNMINLEKTQEELLGLKTELLSIDNTLNSKFDLTLYVREKEHEIQLTLDYNTDLFTQKRMVEMLDQYHHLLAQIITKPDKSINSYSLITPKSKLLLPNPEVILPEPQYKLVTTMFASWAKETPEQTAICQGSFTWNYGDLCQTAQNIAKILLIRGIQKGDTVAVFGTRSFGSIASMMGVFLSGGVLLNIDPKLPSNRQQLLLEKAQAKYLLNVGVRLPNDNGTWESLVDICIEPNTGNVTNFDRDISQINLPEIAPEDPAYIFFTSGTTGVPKGVLGCHKGLSHFLTWQRKNFGIGEQDRVAQLTALSFDVVLRDIFLPLTSGATLCLPKEENILEPTQILSWLDRERISVLHTVPSLGQSWLTNVPVGVSLRNLRWLFFAGEPLPEALVSQWRKSFPQSGEIVNLYGPTETTLAKCYYQIPPNPKSGIQPVGSPIPETQALILNKNNQCGIGEEGEIVIRTPFRTLGYINASQENRRFVTNPFRDDESDLVYYTGDRGRYLPDGSLEILGRLDNQVKIRGVRIEIGEIEAAIGQHPDVRQCIVIAKEDATSGKRLIAYIVANLKTALTNTEIRNFVKHQLPEYMVPSVFMLIETMPLTPNGKVDRRALPAPTITKETEENFIPPTEEIELKLTQIWSEVLDIHPVGIKDNFFDLGGHSLLAVHLFAKIEKLLGISLPLSTLFAAPTIEQLANIIRTSAWTAPWHSLVPIQPEGDRPPLFCVHGGGFNVLIYRELALNLGSNQPVYGLQAKGIDGKTTPHSTIEDMAADYVKYIREIQPEGPYLLAGLSNGGRIALEMAQQLHKQDQKVALLAMFDTHGPGALKLLSPLPQLLSTSGYVVRYSLPRFLARYMQEPSKIASSLSGLLSNYHQLSKKQDLEVKQVQLSVNNSIGNNDESKPKNYFNETVFKFHRFILNHSPVGFYGQNIHVLPKELQKNNQLYKQARKRYVPKVYSGHITVFQASEQAPGFKVDAKFGWGEIAMGGLEIYKIPGHHTSIVRSPKLAKKLAECISKALSFSG